MALTGTKALLVWAQRTTAGYKDVNVANMHKSWKDGLAFCAVLHHYRPDLIDFQSLSKENVRDNNSLAFDVAEQELGIPSLLDPDDMATMRSPDRLSVMTYVSQYYNYFRDKKPVKDVGGQKTRTPSKRPAGDSPQPLASKQPFMGDLCGICGKKVYLVERQVSDGKMYHRNCFRCTKCGTTLRPGNYKTTSNPKQLECMNHGENIWQLRSNIASRASTEKKTPAVSEGSIWETRQDIRPAVKPAAAAVDVAPSKEKPVEKTPAVQGGHQRPLGPGGHQQLSKTPMHPHLIASQASRERFNKPQMAPKPNVSPRGSAQSLTTSDLWRKSDGELAKDQVTRLGLLASLSAVGTAGAKVESPVDVQEGRTSNRAASPCGSQENMEDNKQKPSTDPKEDRPPEEDSPESGPNAESRSRDSGHPTSDVTSMTSLSSVTNSETSSVDTEIFASDVKPAQRSSVISSTLSSCDVEESDKLNLSDLSTDKIEGDTISMAFDHDHEAIAECDEESVDKNPVEIPVEKLPRRDVSPSRSPEKDAPIKETPSEEAVVKETPVAEVTPSDVVKLETSKLNDYDESLNPFGDEEEEEVTQKEDGYKNPFDDSDSEDDAYDDNLNPFGDDDDNNDDNTSLSPPITQWPPPLPAGSKPAEIPNQQSLYKVKTRQEILQEMKRDRDTLKKSKRRAPPRPGGPPRPDGPPRPPTPESQESSQSSAGSPLKPPLRSTKSRHAPTPPSDSKPNADPSKPVPSPRLKKNVLVTDSNGSVSPVPTPRKKISVDRNDIDMPVPSPRTHRAATTGMAEKQLKPPRPSSAPPKPPFSQFSQQGSRKRAPAPPPVKREVAKHHVDPSLIQIELEEISIFQREKEAKGIRLEKKIREEMEANEGQDNEALLVEWFALVNEKNQLLRREGELVAQAQMQDLELQQAEIEYELRCLMHKHEQQKTDADMEREEKLLELLVDAVSQRSQIVERLEDDRKREEAEDQDIQSMMEQSGLDKKNLKKRKHKKKKGISILGI